MGNDELLINKNMQIRPFEYTEDRDSWGIEKLPCM